MPNHVGITISIIGNTNLLGRFVEQAKGVCKPNGDEPGSVNYEEEQKETVFEFDRLVPLPEEYSQYPYSDVGYELEYQTWGTKWGAYRHEEPVFKEVVATYRFTCAWGAPRLFFEKVSRSWPELLFVISFGGEGPELGRFVLLNGEYQSDVKEPDGVAPTYPWDDEDDEAKVQVYYETYETWEQQYRASHDAFVEEIIQRKIEEHALR